MNRYTIGGYPSRYSRLPSPKARLRAAPSQRRMTLKHWLVCGAFILAAGVLGAATLGAIVGLMGS